MFQRKFQTFCEGFKKKNSIFWGEEFLRQTFSLDEIVAPDTLDALKAADKFRVLEVTIISFGKAQSVMALLAPSIRANICRF
jgi:hypothetical protein